jgi:hypothetical protein
MDSNWGPQGVLTAELFPCPHVAECGEIAPLICLVTGRGNDEAWVSGKNDAKYEGTRRVSRHEIFHVVDGRPDVPSEVAQALGKINVPRREFWVKFLEKSIPP